MPIVATALSSLIQQKINDYMEPLGGKPLDQDDPSKFVTMCDAIADGIAAVPTIAFTTSDSGDGAAPPIPGTGVGVGIVFDKDTFIETAYTLARQSVIDDIGATAHDPWPPSAGNSGEFLEAMMRGVGDAIEEHFQTAWILSSVHPLVYSGTGTIDPGGFTGVSGAAVAAAMNLGGGDAAPGFASAIGDAYEAAIANSTGEVNIIGVCVPAPPALICNLPMSGVGTGAAS